MGDYTDVFLEKLDEFEGLIRYASKRYQIPGVLDKEDLQQEALMILDEFVKSDEFDPKSVDFRKMFKTKLWHGLSNVLREHKTQKRDYKRVVDGDISDLAVARGTNSQRAEKTIDFKYFSHKDTPEQVAIANENFEEVAGFLEQLSAQLDEDAQTMLQHLLFPPSWSEIPKENHRNAAGDVYWRTPRRIPQQVLARLLDWPLIRVRRSIKRIRKQADSIGHSEGLEFMDKIGLKARKRRKSNVSIQDLPRSPIF